MTSTLGSARDTPWQGQVKFVPSTGNRFSLTPEPKADTVLTVPLAGEVGDTPGASGPDQIEHAVPPRGNRSEVLWSEASFKTAVSGFGARAGCLDDNRFRHAC